MAELIVLALSNALTAILTAWILHRAKIGVSPIPSFSRMTAGEGQGDEGEVQHEKGRPVL